MPPAVKPIPSYTSRLRSTPIPTARSTMVSAPLPWRDQAAFGPQGDRLPGLVGFLSPPGATGVPAGEDHHARDRKSTRLNSSHVRISYAVFCLKKKKKQ